MMREVLWEFFCGTLGRELFGLLVCWCFVFVGVISFCMITGLVFMVSVHCWGLLVYYELIALKTVVKFLVGFFFYDALRVYFGMWLLVADALTMKVALEVVDSVVCGFKELVVGVVVWKRAPMVVSKENVFQEIERQGGLMRTRYREVGGQVVSAVLPPVPGSWCWVVVAVCVCGVVVVWWM